jgi:hypothetical protein
MIDCMIIGDSIAVGTSMARKECVSLGANDHKGVKTEAELRKMRSTVKADRVFWISLGKDRKQEQMAAITKIAAEYGDTIIPRPEDHMSADKIHPTGKGYKIIGEAAK